MLTIEESKDNFFCIKNAIQKCSSANLDSVCGVGKVFDKDKLQGVVVSQIWNIITFKKMTI